MNKSVLFKIALLLTILSLFLFLQYMAMSGAQHYGSKVATSKTVIPTPALPAL